MLTRLRVQNFKCLREVDIPLTPLHVLIGQNDSGKTSLLQAIRVLSTAAWLELPECFPGIWAGRELVYSGSPTPKIDLGGDWSAGNTSLRYEISAEFWAPGRTCTLTREVLREGTEAHVLTPDPLAPRTRLRQFVTGTSFDSRLSEILARAVRTISVAELYRLNPARLSQPCVLDMQWGSLLGTEGFGLAGLLDNILGTSVEQFLEIQNEFREFFPQFEGIQVRTQAAQRSIPHSDGSETYERATGKGIAFRLRGGQVIDASQVSDGAMLFLGIITLLGRKDRPKILLLEEPENGIYPKRLEQFLQLLRRYVESREESGTQVVVTTHSPYVISHFKPDEVTFMRRQSDVVQAVPLQTSKRVQEFLDKGFYLGELWYNLSEEELFGDV